MITISVFGEHDVAGYYWKSAHSITLYSVFFLDND